MRALLLMILSLPLTHQALAFDFDDLVRLECKAHNQEALEYVSTYGLGIHLSWPGLTVFPQKNCHPTRRFGSDTIDCRSDRERSHWLIFMPSIKGSNQSNAILTTTQDPDVQLDFLCRAVINESEIDSYPFDPDSWKRR